MLTTAREHYRLSALITRRAVASAGTLRGRGDLAVVRSVQTHQIAQAQAASTAFDQMLAEQDIDAIAQHLLNSEAFITDTELMLEMIDAAGDDGFDRLVGSLTQNAGRAAESVLVVSRPRIGHVRYLNPPSCSRCAVLAGRVYRWSTGFLRHPGCDCVMIPTVLANDELVQDPVELMKQGLVTGLSKADHADILAGEPFAKVVNSHRRGLSAPGTAVRRKGKPTIEQVLASAEGREDAATELADIGYSRPRRSTTATTGGNGSGSIPPKTPPAPDDVPDPEDRDAFLAYWKARQDALESDTTGSVLKPSEVEFLERFEALGERVEWIPEDRVTWKPTNDFYWRTNGSLPAEQKSTKAQYSTIKNAINGAVRRSQIHGLPKQNFIIDISPRYLGDKLLTQLERYNQRNPIRQIENLWVLHRGGLTKINLR